MGPGHDHKTKNVLIEGCLRRLYLVRRVWSPFFWSFLKSIPVDDSRSWWGYLVTHFSASGGYRWQSSLGIAGMDGYAIFMHYMQSNILTSTTGLRCG